MEGVSEDHAAIPNHGQSIFRAVSDEPVIDGTEGKFDRI